jgi:hypothetical protein
MERVLGAESRSRNFGLDLAISGGSRLYASMQVWAYALVTVLDVRADPIEAAVVAAPWRHLDDGLDCLLCQRGWSCGG